MLASKIRLVYFYVRLAVNKSYENVSIHLSILSYLSTLSVALSLKPSGSY